MKKEFKALFKEFYNLLELTAFKTISKNETSVELIELFLENEVDNEDYLEVLVNFFHNNFDRIKSVLEKDYFKPKFKNVITGELLSKYDCELYLIEQEELKRILA